MRSWRVGLACSVGGGSGAGAVVSVAGRSPGWATIFVVSMLFCAIVIAAEVQREIRR